MRVLVACEFSGVVRDAFLALGHDAWSCDLLPTEVPGPHIEGDVFLALAREWDLMIAHPPCTYLANSGNKHLTGKLARDGREAMAQEAAQFFRDLLNADVPRIAVENPVMRHAVERVGRKQDQTIQPWQFGHGEVKRTCLWLKNLPKLVPTNVVDGREARVHREPPGPNRWKNRSRTYQGIADAMAHQWGGLPHL